MQPYPMGPGQFMGAEAPGATASMVCGIISLALVPLGCCTYGLVEIASLPLGIVAVVLGFRARKGIAQSLGTSAPLGGASKALAGIITGFIGIGFAVIVAILVALLGLSFATLQNLQNTFPSPSP